MLNKIHSELNEFSLDIKTIKSHEELLAYMNSNFYASIKLLISVSRTFSLYWRVVLPFIVSLCLLLVLSNIEPIGEQLRGLLNINYMMVILLCLVSLKLVYILYCKKYLISCIQKSKNLMEKAAQTQA